MEIDYNIIKSLHIIAIICWFAGLFYLPRLFVYHTMAEPKSSESTMLKTMERKLYRYIMQPSMVFTWVFGLWLVFLTPEWMQEGWMHTKLLFVVALTGFHHICGVYVKKFANNSNLKSEKYFRIFNEIPTIILIIVIFLVVLKPF
tara:strand:- start:113046 stop:113480 length:435 start_codon:yes stop_codon:yes gene_type:complete